MQPKDLGLIDKSTYMYVLGSLMENPKLLDNYDNINENDFDYGIAKTVFRSIAAIHNDSSSSGEMSYSANRVEAQIALYPSLHEAFCDYGGIDFLTDCVEYGAQEVHQFELHYKRLKKLALLRTLKRNHYDVSYYYKENYSSTKEERETTERFDNANVDDIIGYLEGGLQTIKSEFLQSGRRECQADYQIHQLIESFKMTPNVGPDLNGDWFNTVTNGARLGCYYLKSASSGTGKTRTSVFDACKLCYPIRYSLQENAFIREKENVQPKPSRKVLFIVTEMDNEELQTIILAYISRVNEYNITTGRYDILKNEEWRVQQAAKIMETFKGNFIIETVSDPNLTNISAIMKRHAMVDGIQYMFFDYIHSSPSLLNQFAAAKVREDRPLVMSSRV